jgi:hypothetical protein
VLGCSGSALANASEAIFGRLVLVDVEVVQENVKFADGIGLDDFVHETEKVHRGAPVADMRHHFAGSDFRGSQLRLRAMTDVFVGPLIDRNPAPSKCKSYPCSRTGSRVPPSRP